MTQNFLLLNTKKEVIVLGSKHISTLLSNQVINLDGNILVPSSTVRNLGVLFDQGLSLDKHIKQTSRIAFNQLRNIKKIRNILSKHDTEKRCLHNFQAGLL